MGGKTLKGKRWMARKEKHIKNLILLLLNLMVLIELSQSRLLFSALIVSLHHCIPALLIYCSIKTGEAGWRRGPQTWLLKDKPDDSKWAERNLSACSQLAFAQHMACHRHPKQRWTAEMQAFLAEVTWLRTQTVPWRTEAGPKEIVTMQKWVRNSPLCLYYDFVSLKHNSVLLHFDTKRHPLTCTYFLCYLAAYSVKVGSQPLQPLQLTTAH